MHTTQKVNSNPLRDWYYDLPVRRVASYRVAIIKHCGINLAVFYRWLSGTTPIPYTAQVILNQVTGKKLFEVEEPIRLNENESPESDA